MYNYFFLSIFTLFLKKLWIIVFIFFESRSQANCETGMTRVHLWNFVIVKILNFVAMRFYFGFQKIFIIDRLAIKHFFDISTDFIQNSVTFF